jgi:hypothetical protein
MSLVVTIDAQGANENIVAAEGITLSLDFGNGTTREYDNLNGSTVLNVTSSVLDVEVQWYGSFAYIRGIEGLVGVGDTGWEYWVNGEFASIAVNLYVLHDSDSILWKYTSPQPHTQYDPTFIPGLIIVSLSGMGFLCIVYIQTSRRIK